MREGAKEEEEEGKRKSSKYLIYGGLAGAVARTVMAPIERVKILQQLGRGFETTKASSELSRGEGLKISTLLRYMRQEDFGRWKSMWRGNAGNVIRIIPA